MTTLASSAAPNAAGIREIDARTAQGWLAAGQAVLIDVREPDEHARERIAGATLHPLSKFDPAGLGTGRRIVLHCKGGKRSAEACRLALGRAEVYSLAGGIEGWKAAGLPVEASAGGVGMSVMRQTQIAIGAIVLAGAALTYFLHPLFIVVPAFMGAGLVFAGASGTCGMATLIGMMPWNRVACAGGCASGSCGA